MNYRLQRPGTGQNFWLQRILRLPGNLSLSRLSLACYWCLDLTGKIIDFNLSIIRIDKKKQKNPIGLFSSKRKGGLQLNKFSSCPVSHLLYNYFCVNAAPCRWLAWGKESIKCEKLYQPHGTRPHQNKNRKTVNLDPCHQTGPVSGHTIFL